MLFSHNLLINSLLGQEVSKARKSALLGFFTWDSSLQLIWNTVCCQFFHAFIHLGEERHYGARFLVSHLSSRPGREP